jgi:hypothetical protein
MLVTSRNGEVRAIGRTIDGAQCRNICDGKPVPSNILSLTQPLFEPFIEAFDTVRATLD